jgi:hypothetical protein
VGREELDGAGRGHAQLDARAADLLADDPLLDDATHRDESPQIGVERHAGRLQLHLHDALEHLLAAGRTLGREAGQVHDGVPPAGHPLVELHDHAGQSRTLAAHVGDRLDHVVGGVDVLRPDRVPHPDLTEQSSAPGLRPEIGQTRVRAVHRDAEADGQVTLVFRRVVGHEVGALGVRDPVGDPVQETWSGEELLAQRRR